MKNLVIIGARGFGRKVYDLATQCNEFQKEYIIKGFLDDKYDVLDNYSGYPNILGPVEDYQVDKNDVFVCALGDVKWKRFYSQIINNKGGIFINLIHPSSIINSNCKLGIGSIILNGVIISNDSVLGDFVSIQPFSVIGHDSEIGDYCHLNSYCFTGGYSVLESSVTLHTKATILPKKKVGHGSIVGAMSLVNRDVKPKTTVVGVPAKKI
jgi:sugar O-acyltransferase (sialic acid O-acetyltransferase NeuD family)